MPSVVAFVASFAKMVVFAAIGGFGAAAQIFTQVVAFSLLDAGLRKVLKKEFDNSRDLGTRDISTRSATANANIIYGKVLVGGVLRYSGTSGTENEFLWRSDILAGHECEDITNVWLDDYQILAADINWGTDGKVTSGKFANYVWFYKKLGTSTQTVNAALDSAFTDITTSHAAKGRCLIEMKAEWIEASNSIWDQTGAIQNLKGLVSGKNDIYDPRLDTSPGANPANASYQAYTDNPVLCLANYLTDSRLGMGIAASRIDWDFISNEATYCDVLSPEPGGQAVKRYTCNGVLSTGNTHRENIFTLLSSFNGRMSFRGSKWIIRSGRLGEGENLCGNPTFDTGIVGYANASGAGTVSYNASLKRLKLTNAAGGMQTSTFAISVVAGTTYTARTVTKEDSVPNAANNYGFAVTYNTDGQTDKVAIDTTTETNAELRVTFKAATTGIIYLSFYANTTTSGKEAEFDDVEIYFVTDVNVDADWLAGDISIAGSPPKEDRYNRVDVIYISPDNNYKTTEALPVSSTDYLNRDNGELLIDELALSMTNSEIGAQRLATKHLNKSDKPKTFRIPCNYKALKLAPHDFISFSLPELALTDQLMRVRTYRLSDIGDAQGVELITVEDDADTYADPNESQYSTRTAAGVISLAAPSVPDPTALSVAGKQGGILVEWANPGLSNTFDLVEVYASLTDDRTASTMIFSGRADSFFHKLDNGETYFYWIRAVKDDLSSDYLPNTLTSIITATSGDELSSAATTALWSGIVDDGGRPANNATVGSIWNGNIVGQPSDGNILNSALTVLANGTISGAGGGQVTIVGLGFNGSLDATDNTITSSAVDPTGGINGSLHYNTATKSWWAKIAGTWIKAGDETAQNIAASIASQGDLAILNSADWATQISGANKPENNAQVNTVNFLGTNGVSFTGTSSTLKVFEVSTLPSPASYLGGSLCRISGSGITYRCDNPYPNAGPAFWVPFSIDPADYLAVGAKAADSELLDNLNSTQFLRADAANTTDIIVTKDSGNFIVNLTTETAGGLLIRDAEDVPNQYLDVTFNSSGTTGAGKINTNTTLLMQIGGSTKATLTAASIVFTGALSKGSGSFRIPHPLEAMNETHELVHSFIEGPQADLIYRGKVALVDGVATVNIDADAKMTEGTFEALCRDVSCFTSNETAWDSVRGSVSGNVLTIECKDKKCADVVSWLVIGERKDPHMYETDWTDDEGRVIVEPELTIDA